MHITRDIISYHGYARAIACSERVTFPLLFYYVSFFSLARRTATPPHFVRKPTTTTTTSTTATMKSAWFLVFFVSQSVVDLASSQHDDDASRCSCHSKDYFDRPSHSDQEKTARWMLSTIRWGILSTISSRLVMDSATGEVIPAVPGSDAVKICNDEEGPVPFGNVFSFADAPCGNSSPDIYLCKLYYLAFIQNAVCQIRCLKTKLTFSTHTPP